MEEQLIIEKLSEYLSIAPHLTEFSPDEQYQRANQLALELAMVLPAYLFAMIAPSLQKGGNIFDVVFAARKRYGYPEPLDPDTVFLHAPGIGKKEKP